MESILFYDGASQFPRESRVGFPSKFRSTRPMASVRLHQFILTMGIISVLVSMGAVCCSDKFMLYLMLDIWAFCSKSPPEIQVIWGGMWGFIEEKLHYILRISIYLCTYLCVCTCESLCVPYAVRCPQRPENGIGPPESGLTGSCES